MNAAQSGEEIVREFDALPLEHKACLTFKDVDGAKSSVRLPDKYLARRTVPGFILQYFSSFSPRRMFEAWDYVKFLNSQL